MFAMFAVEWRWQKNIFASPPKSKDETIESSSSLGDLEGFVLLTRDANRDSLEEFERAYFMKKNHQMVISGTQTRKNSRERRFSYEFSR
jgi:hypothetical protein